MRKYRIIDRNYGLSAHIGHFTMPFQVESQGTLGAIFGFWRDHGVYVTESQAHEVIERLISEKHTKEIYRKVVL